MAERPGYRPDPPPVTEPRSHRLQTGNSHGRQEDAAVHERMRRAERLKDQIPYTDYVDLRSGREPGRFNDWWKGLKKTTQTAIVGGAVAGLGLAYVGLHEFGMWQTRNVKPTRPIEPSTVPGHDVIPTTEPSVSVTSTPPGRPPLRITVPKR